ncbi:hypothetical protein [Streptomyces sp. NPDC002685]
MTYFMAPLAAAFVVVALSTLILVRRDRRRMAFRRPFPGEHD